MATVNTLLTYARAQAQTNSTGLTDTNGIEFANEAITDFRRKLISAGVDAAQVQEAYRDITAATGTYLYPTDMYWLKAIEVNYADQNSNNYITATQVDASNIPNQKSFSWLRQYATSAGPYFDDRGDWFEIFPTPQFANSQGLRILYFLEPPTYTATSDTIQYPESLDFRLLALRVVANYYNSLNKFEAAEAINLKYEEKVKSIIQTLARGTQQPLQATPISWSGFEF